MMKWEFREGKIVRACEESRIGAFGSNAVLAYLNEPADARISRRTRRGGGGDKRS